MSLLPGPNEGFKFPVLAYTAFDCQECKLLCFLPIKKCELVKARCGFRWVSTFHLPPFLIGLLNFVDVVQGTGGVRLCLLVVGLRTG